MLCAVKFCGIKKVACVMWNKPLDKRKSIIRAEIIGVNQKITFAAACSIPVSRKPMYANVTSRLTTSSTDSARSIESCASWSLCTNPSKDSSRSAGAGRAGASLKLMHQVCIAGQIKKTIAYRWGVSNSSAIACIKLPFVAASAPFVMHSIIIRTIRCIIR